MPLCLNGQMNGQGARPTNVHARYVDLLAAALLEESRGAAKRSARLDRVPVVLSFLDFLRSLRAERGR